MVDVFIPRRRSRAGRRFGFIRMASEEDADQVIERLHGFWLYGAWVSVTYAIRGDIVVSQDRRQSRARGARVRVMTQDESKESVNDGQRSGYRQMEGVVDEAKKKVLNTYTVVWCKGSL
ncbi:hypothetical protein V6N13_048553 [Hibiscus sabdariffa]